MSSTDAVVVDASVAVKWVLNEELTSQSRDLLTRTLRERIPIVAPPHLRSEVSNALYQRTRRRSKEVRITDAMAHSALTEFLRFPIQVLGPTELYRRSFEFGKAHSLASIYDALYVTLAGMVQADLWTDDRELLGDVGSSAPWVRWIGDYPTEYGR